MNSKLKAVKAIQKGAKAIAIKHGVQIKPIQEQAAMKKKKKGPKC